MKFRKRRNFVKSFSFAHFRYHNSTYKTSFGISLNIRGDNYLKNNKNSVSRTLNKTTLARKMLRHKFFLLL